jgi:hypothetical protein
VPVLLAVDERPVASNREVARPARIITHVIHNLGL